MKVRVHVLGAFRRYLGDRRQEVELPGGANLQRLMEELHVRWKEILPPDLWDAARHRPDGSVMILVGGRRAERDALPLCEGEEVLLLAPSFGG